MKLYNTVEDQHNVKHCLAHIIRSIPLAGTGADLLLNNVNSVVRKLLHIVKQVVVFHYSTYEIHTCNLPITATLYTTLTAQCNVILYVKVFKLFCSLFLGAYSRELHSNISNRPRAPNPRDTYVNVSGTHKRKLKNAQLVVDLGILTCFCEKDVTLLMLLLLLLL